MKLNAFFRNFFAPLALGAFVILPVALGGDTPKNGAGSLKDYQTSRQHQFEIPLNGASCLIDARITQLTTSQGLTADFLATTDADEKSAQLFCDNLGKTTKDEKYWSWLKPECDVFSVTDDKNTLLWGVQIHMSGLRYTSEGAKQLKNGVAQMTRPEDLVPLAEYMSSTFQKVIKGSPGFNKVKFDRCMLNSDAVTDPRYPDQCRFYTEPILVGSKQINGEYTVTSEKKLPNDFCTIFKNTIKAELHWTADVDCKERDTRLSLSTVIDTYPLKVYYGAYITLGNVKYTPRGVRDFKQHQETINWYDQDSYLTPIIKFEDIVERVAAKYAERKVTRGRCYLNFAEKSMVMLPGMRSLSETAVLATKVVDVDGTKQPTRYETTITLGLADFSYVNRKTSTTTTGSYLVLPHGRKVVVATATSEPEHPVAGGGGTHKLN